MTEEDKKLLWPMEYTEEVEGVETIPTTGDEAGFMTANDVVYSTVDGHDLHLQILAPITRLESAKMLRGQTGLETYPCFVYCQGSGWEKQPLYANIPNLSKLVKRGFTAAVVEYRHSGIASFPAPIEDMRNAIRFLKLNAAKYRIDPEKIVIGGDSSGGHTAVFSGFWEDDEKETNLFPGTSASVRGIIDYYGAVTFMPDDANPMCPYPKNLSADWLAGKYMGHKDLAEHPELRKALSVEYNLKQDSPMPPVLIFHGTRDPLVNPKCSVIFYRLLKEYGMDASMYFIKDGSHGGPDFWTENVLDIVEAFIRRVTK